MNTNEEKWLMNEFQKLFTPGILEDIVKQDSPDFIANFNGQRVGIELTEIFQDSSFNIKDSKLQKQSKEAEKFIELLIAKIQLDSKTKFGIGINLSRSYPIQKSKREALLLEVKEIILSVLADLDDEGFIELNSDICNLPQEIIDISIHRDDNLEESFNFKLESGTINPLTLEILQSVISKKERKLKDYKPCDLYWLIIREGNYLSGSFNVTDLPKSINSLYDKVFLLRTNQHELLELK